MKKALILIFIILSSIILGALYGVVHDQITYTISEEYYTKLKFWQFNLDQDYWVLGENIGTGKQPEIELRNPRIGVSIVGVLATWWVGLIIGVMLGLVGLFHRKAKNMLFVTIRAILIIIGISFFSSIIGLCYGYLFLLKDYPNWYLPDNLIDRDSFVLVRSIHIFSYIGSLLGLIVGIIFSLKNRKAQFKNKN